ncbi:2-amino-4-hydroxy-6-hydroxymethyldihydropteridine diphosphokinase [Marinobacter sp. JSM 1782161]|uniref:2-amino-4-hydroxy-6- hydroxymethyldihydropteridine diphosphokinase n=1 Tax=Marinobacter sp. JSM 1782161 TaxID=2685906 RepID=UPI0014032110|nr:2-amino-4-hydroxy-6-hydroxymethyldihydropteridine diphosphokinase [Marinobacter sp. JSM 1782161]
MTDAATVYLGIGSNRDRERHILAALNALSERYELTGVSSVFESESVGFEGSLFYNMVVGIRTGESVATLSRFLKGLEIDNGHQPGMPKFSPRTLDLDILTYDDRIGVIDGVELPRGEILTNAFVLWPLAEIAPDEQHPVDGRTYRELWAAYDRDQKLWPIALRWQGRAISPRPGTS